MKEKLNHILRGGGGQEATTIRISKLIDEGSAGDQALDIWRVGAGENERSSAERFNFAPAYCALLNPSSRTGDASVFMNSRR